MSDGGKGSARRPGVIPDENWNRIFKKDKAMIETEDDPPKPDPDQPLFMLLKASEQCGLCNMAKNKCGCCPTEDGPAEDRPPYERRKTNREGV